MYEQSREQELYQFTARQRRTMEDRQNSNETSEGDEFSAEDYYLEGGEELNFG